MDSEHNRDSSIQERSLHISSPTAQPILGVVERRRYTADYFIATPLASELVVERGLDILKIRGTGIDGLIFWENVKSHKGWLGQMRGLASSFSGSINRTKKSTVNNHEEHLKELDFVGSINLDELSTCHKEHQAEAADFRSFYYSNAIANKRRRYELTKE
ncbi:hypothetical protein [Parasitella parasitica]|uniref:Uncharacterized protein n=1 Tax=Parasitella parasitica TaxID=35722 RepID=A0A0B7MV03_9FUNG|nr:hypothetical protein [Parasitella parasitica]